MAVAGLRQYPDIVTAIRSKHDIDIESVSGAIRAIKHSVRLALDFPEILDAILRMWQRTLSNEMLQLYITDLTDNPDAAARLSKLRVDDVWICR